MIYQDASQANIYWCIGKLPEPRLVVTTSKDYWIIYVPVRIVAG